MVGGYDSVTELTDKVEVIDLSSDELTCTDPASFPVPGQSGVGFVVDEKPVSCINSACYQYNNPDTNTWETVRKKKIFCGNPDRTFHSKSEPQKSVTR